MIRNGNQSNCYRKCELTIPVCGGGYRKSTCSKSVLPVIALTVN